MLFLNLFVVMLALIVGATAGFGRAAKKRPQTTVVYVDRASPPPSAPPATLEP